MSAKRTALIEDGDFIVDRMPRNSSDDAGLSEDTDSDEGGLEELVFGGFGKLSEGKESGRAGTFFIDKDPSVTETRSSVAWHDDDDDDEDKGIETIGAASSRGLGNLRHQPLLKANRKTEFEKTVGETPSWSVLGAANPSNDAEEDFSTTNYNYVTKSGNLPKNIIAMNRCADMNQQQSSQKGLKACEFHKSAQIGLTASSDCRLHLFQVDGKSNPKIHSFYMEKFPIECAHFLASGEEIVMTSKFRHFYSYDMIGGKVVKVMNIKGTDDTKLRGFRVSPDGKHLMFISRYGQMHLLSSATKELVNTMRMNGSVYDATFTDDGKHIVAFGEEGVVNIWDVRSQLCMHTFVDEGCTRGTSIAISPNGKFVACGSRSGIVNIYDETCFTSNSPKPVKTFKNLKTCAKKLVFNATTEILAMASPDEENAVKLIHMRSLTAFSNFPGFRNDFLKYPKQLDFSSNSGYLAIGNSRGRAILYRLDHYKSY